MRTLVFCDDSAHPASLTRDGLAPLEDCGLEFDWVEDPSEWRIESLNQYPLVIFSKANNRSRADHEPWATEETGQAFVEYVAAGNGILILHSGTALYDNSPSLCRLMGGVFTGHPAQCPVTVAPLAAHPLTAGCAPFTLMDEHYMMEMNDPDVDLFLHSESEHGRQPAGWTRRQGKGRVCVVTPGHNPEVWRHPSFQALLRNCLSWCTPKGKRGAVTKEVPTLPRRRLGRTELDIPVVPFGTLGFSNSFGFVRDEDAVGLIRHAISLGANHFDCSRCYGDSMRKLGLALREIPRQDIIITGRLCCHSDAPWGGYGGAGEADYSAERAVRDVEDQLVLLGTDYFDGVMIHDPNRIEPTLARAGSLAGLLQLKARGLVRNVGYGMEPHDFHLQAIATGDVDLLLCFNDYNLVRQTAADTILPAATAADVGVLNGWSILRGLLTGVDIDEVRTQRRHRGNDDAEAARAYWNWCREEQIDLLQLAIQFCLREKRIHGNPIGSLNKEQLEANIRAASTPLDESVWTSFQERFGIVV